MNANFQRSLAASGKVALTVAVICYDLGQKVIAFPARTILSRLGV